MRMLSFQERVCGECASRARYEVKEGLRGGRRCRRWVVCEGVGGSLMAGVKGRGRRTECVSEGWGESIGGK